MHQLLALVAAALIAACSGHRLPPAAESVVIETSRGNFPLGVYPPEGRTKAVLLLASGDGGWSDLEEKMARALAEDGFAVVGWDSRKYAGRGTYDASALARDVEAALRTTRNSGRPVVLAGFSTGAEQMVAVAAGPARPERLAGLLLLSPGERGRYGIALSDLMGLKPSGPGTFALEELAPALGTIPVFQIHGENDPLDQTDWLAAVRGPHQLEVFPDGWHLYRGGPPEFLSLVVRGGNWILDRE